MNLIKDSEEKLREAACFGDLILLKELILKGVNVNSKNDMNGWTALHWAACRNNVEAAVLLLDSGADKNILTFKGQSANELTSNGKINTLLGGTFRKNQQNLPIIPNYIKNPPLVCGGAKTEVIDMSPIPTLINNDLIVKVRVAGTFDSDFIEVELSKLELTYEKLKNICCEELGIEPVSVYKIKKLPNTIMRNDKDIKRLKEFDEIEIITKKFNEI